MIRILAQNAIPVALPATRHQPTALLAPPDMYYFLRARRAQPAVLAPITLTRQMATVNYAIPFVRNVLPFLLPAKVALPCIIYGKIIATTPALIQL
jgi:hypothetical protein